MLDLADLELPGGSTRWALEGPILCGLWQPGFWLCGNGAEGWILNFRVL